jgi:hypothetical protein
VSPSRKASNLLLRDWGKDITGHVLSIGSGTDEDKQGGHYRDYFPKAESYTTSEPKPSQHCDLVLDVRDLGVSQCLVGKYDALFCSGVLEHVDDIFQAVVQFDLLLRPGGILLVGVPFNQPSHRAPQDFWRFTEDGLKYLLGRRSFEVLSVVAIGNAAYPTSYWAKARKPA